MRGEFIEVWASTWWEIWLPVQPTGEEDLVGFERLLRGFDFSEDYEKHEDLIADLYREIVNSFRKDLREQIDIVEIVNDPARAENEFRAIESSFFESEMAILDFFEKAYGIFCDFDELLAMRYRILLKSFIKRYNLKYELGTDCQIFSTLPGVFAALLRQVILIASRDEHLKVLMLDFKSAFRDLKLDQSAGRIKVCVHKLFVLVEAISLGHPEVKGNGLGKACKEIGTWPHSLVGESLAKLYGFSSDYPGIRHGGRPGSKKRDLEMRDFVALNLLLTAYTPYLTEEINFQDIYLAR